MRWKSRAVVAKLFEKAPEFQSWKSLVNTDRLFHSAIAITIAFSHIISEILQNDIHLLITHPVTITHVSGSWYARRVMFSYSAYFSSILVVINTKQK